MKRTMRTAAVAAVTPVVAAAVAALAGCALAPGRGGVDARVERRVVEDDAVRIDETRVRGQPTRLTVSPKAASAPAYEIVPPRGGRDPSQARDGAGQRVWTLGSF